MLVIVGSSSGIKLKAVKTCFPDHVVKGVDNFESGVPPQPIGKSQTIQGARYRAEYAKKSEPEGDIWIGIENGMFQDLNQKWLDAAAIVILERDAGESIIWSDCIEIPDGMEKGPCGEWSVLKDPHIVVTGKPRHEYLSEAIKNWLENRE